MDSPSPITLAILLGFFAVFFCLEHLQAAAKIQTSHSQSGLARFVASALLPAVLSTFGLTLLLLVVHVRALSRAGVPGAGGAGLDRLAKVTLAAASVALIAGGVMGFVAD
ncbi:hypothetical protein HU200_019653 [Digitaria exilis]|uniref:Uncharacterized protein n=1 Tax=Digitaria exilis TaxID=1010633 RepID=A0A835KHR0_9POAL|nr:hypothetical protein HU200_019653 [Digitaria exilis]CAB3467376.1 unnamed protein product [Digitaria exilis]CAB3469894.1 unnamed protein product [Digitaria exilis]